MQLSVLDRLALVRGFVSVTRNPANLDGVLDLGDRIASREGAFEHVPAPVRAATEASDPTWELPELAALRALPDGTLGREYARFMDSHGLIPEALAREAGDEPLARFRAQIRAAHDLWHVTTGWSLDLLGELGLQAFTLAQLRVPFSAFIVAAGLLHVAWKAPAHFYDVVDAVVEGYRQGQEATPLAAVPWGQWLDQPLDAARVGLGVRPAVPRPAPVVPLLA